MSNTYLLLSHHLFLSSNQNDFQSSAFAFYILRGGKFPAALLVVTSVSTAQNQKCNITRGYKVYIVEDFTFTWFKILKLSMDEMWIVRTVALTMS